MKKISIILSITFIISSCGGGGGGGGTAPTPTTPLPTVNLSADPVSVLLGSTSTLTWSSTNTTSCSASWTTQTGSSGSEAVTISTAGNNSFSISCTGAGGSRSATATVEGYRNTDGVVVDGYISGAEVCIDEDESWTCDSSESSTTSDNDGKFTIKYANGNLVSIGGTDLDSQTLLDNLLITHKLTGHSDFKAVTPVTSVAAFMTDASLVNAALGIDGAIDVSTFDPVANKGDGGINDYLYEKGNQLTVLAYALQNITNNLNTTTETTQDYFKAITEEIEKEYTETETKVDIETEEFITKTLDNIVEAKTVTITDEAKDNTTKALSGVMPIIEVKSSDDLTTSVIRFAVSTLQTDIQAIANGTASAETVASYSSDVLTYIAEDQNIEADEITPDISAIADSATTSEDISVTINVVLNDSYLTSAPISVSAGNASNGTTTLAESSPEQIVYSPNTDYNGTDTFTYTITQGDKTSSADVTITIEAANDAPSIDTASTIQVAENQTAITTVSISDVDEDDLTLTLGGTDADSFNLSADNVLAFKEAPDFETKSSYSITLSLTDGIEAVDKDISIVITDVNEFGIDGRAAKGVIGGATITVVDSAGADVAIASGGTTGADGSYTIIFDQAEVSAPIVVTVVGGDGATMVCDIDLAGTDDDCAVGDGTSVSFGESYPLPETFALRGLVAEIPTEDGASATVNITPASDLATNLALASADTNALTAADVEAASSQVLGLIQTITGTDLSGLDINDIAIPDVADSADAAAASESSLALAAFSAAIIANQGDGETVSDVIDRVNATLLANSEGDLTASGTELSSLTNSVITALITVSDQVIAGGGDSSVVDQAIANAEVIEEVYEAIGSEDISIPPIDNIAPVIKVSGDNPVTIELGSTYIDAGATADGGEIVITSGTIPYISGTFVTSTVGSYTLTYSATDTAGNTGTIDRTVNIVDTTAPQITSNPNFTADENQSEIGEVLAFDLSPVITFTVSGSEIAITSAGVLTFVSAPDYETKSTYTATVTATDGTNPTTQDITVNITDVDEIGSTPEITSPNTFSVSENQTAIGTVTATDADDDEVTFTVSGSEIAITSAGVLTFVSAPDYETKSTYTATVTATDGTNPATQNITINVTNVNEAPVITNFANILSTEENQVNVYQVNAQDYEGDSIFYSISGTDKSFFNISSSGLVTFKTAPDYENPLDSGFNNSYSINIEVSDGQLSQNNIQPSSNGGFAPENGSFAPELKTEQTSNSTEIVIANVDEDLIDLVLYSSDGTTSSSPTLSIDLKIDELTRASEVHVLTWLKDNSQTWYYASKNDSLNWSINEILNKYASAGIYEIRQVLIKRNGLSDLTIVDTALKEKGFDIDTDIANANSDNTDPLLKGIDSITVSGNDGNSETNIVVTIVASVEDTGSGVEKVFSYIKAPGGDITGSYAVLNDSKNKATFTFILDSRAASGTYSIDDIRITDAAGNEKFFYNTDISEAGFTSSLVINNNIADDLAPNITELNLTSSINTSDLNRKQITVDLTIDEQVTDIKRIYIRLISPDGANIDSDSFTAVGLQVENKYSNTISLPLEYPDGTYNVSYIFLNDAALNQKSYSAYELSELGFDTSVVFGEVTNSNSPPVFTSNSSFTVEENQNSAANITVTDADSDSISFSLSGTDADSFAISSSGALTFNNAPDYETKESYSLIITASDGSSSVSQTINISITNVNEVPQISALSSTQTPDENQVSVVTVSASDPDASITLTYTLSGIDSSLFAISSSGVLTFISAPDYEVPGDADGDNNYQINVVVSDGSLSVTQAITIQVQNVADLISGVAVDGYVAGATVFQDLNNDGDLDSGEPSAATNSLGSFSLNLSSVNINAPVRIYNGFDLASNEIHPSIMDISVSETGSYIVTPISTLVGRLKIEDTSLTAMIPQSMIAGALGISLADSPNDSILGFDPIAYFNGSDTTLASEARPVFAASQLLMTIGGGNYSIHKYITDQALSALSSTLTTAAGTSITLSSATDIIGLKQDAYDAIFNGYVDTTLANNPPINSIQLKNNKAVMTDYLNGSSSSAVNYSLYGFHGGSNSTLFADLVGAKLDYENLKQILDNNGTGTPMDLNFELSNVPAAGSGSTGVTFKLFYGDDITQDDDEDYLQITLTANWESDGTNFTIKLPASSSITASFFDRSGTILSVTPTNQVEDIFTVTKDGPNRPATLSLRLSKLFNAFPTEVTGLSSFLDGAAQFTYLVEFDNFTIYDHLDNPFTKIQGNFEVDTNPGITVFADDIYVHENATSKAISFYLSQATASDVTLDYAIADLSTASSSDYTLSSGTVTIPAGSMSATLTIPVTNDTTVEDEEEIMLSLSNVQNAVLGRSNVSAFITDGEEILANTAQKAVLADNIFKDSKASINAYIKNKLDTTTITISGTSYTYSQVLVNNSITSDVYAYLDSIIDDYEVMSETLISTIMTKADAYIDSQLSSFASYTGFATGLTQLNSGIKGLDMSQIVGTNINSNGTFPSGQNATTLQTALDGKVDTLVTLAADTVADILGTDTNTNFPNANVVMGTDGNDTITGTSGSDLIASFNGTDTVNGLAGNDKILGGSGVDTLNGGDDNDHIYGYAGNDVLNGNADADKILGGKDNDTINGGAGDDDLRGEAGDDTITTGAGSDTVSGGLGDDTIIIDAL